MAQCRLQSGLIRAGNPERPHEDSIDIGRDIRLPGNDKTSYNTSINPNPKKSHDKGDNNLTNLHGNLAINNDGIEVYDWPVSDCKRDMGGEGSSKTDPPKCEANRTWSNEAGLYYADRRHHKGLDRSRKPHIDKVQVKSPQSCTSWVNGALPPEHTPKRAAQVATSHHNIESTMKSVQEKLMHAPPPNDVSRFKVLAKDVSSLDF